MSKSLIIVHTINEFKRLNKFINKSNTLLALSPDVMLKLDRNEVKYITIEEIYSHEKYYEDIVLFNKDLEKFLTSLDAACNHSIEFPFSYTGNALYLFSWFDELVYLEKLIQKISINYSKVFLFSNNSPKKISWSKFGYSELISHPSKGTVSLPMERNLERDIKLLYEVLDVSLILDSSLSLNKVPIKRKINAFQYRIKSYLQRKIIDLKRKGKISTTKNNAILICQDGYEVNALKKYLNEFNFLNPMPSLRERLNNVQVENFDYALIEEILTSFTAKEFPFLKRHVELLIGSYHKEIVGRVEYFKKISNNYLKSEKPKALLFSMGIRDVFDFIIAEQANEKNIPVVFFQHGGSVSFFYQFPMYQKYLELNPKIKKTTIMSSKYDLEKTKHKGSKTLALGSILKYEMLQVENQSKEKEILYITRPYNFSSYRTLLDNSSGKVMYQSCSDILSVIDRNSLKLDIKLHPSCENNAYSFFSDITRLNTYKNINIIYGRSAESIFESYNLIIFDYLGTALLSFLLAHRVRVILYLINFDILKISEIVKDDLRSRCYIARNPEELNFYISKYFSGNLELKWNEDFIDKYIYPVANGNPGENIANYIRSVV
jgi:hypothetical protein